MAPQEIQDIINDTQDSWASLKKNLPDFDQETGAFIAKSLEIPSLSLKDLSTLGATLTKFDVQYCVNTGLDNWLEMTESLNN